MNTDNGTDWDKVGNAIIIYHQQEEAPLWLSREDLEEMLRVLEGEDCVVRCECGNSYLHTGNQQNECTECVE